MKFTPSLFVTGLKCLICGKEYHADNRFTCSDCGVQGILDVQYNYDSVLEHLKSNIGHRPFDHWRYRELLPVSPELPLPHLHVGWTPVYDVPRLANHMGISKLFLKDDSRNPTNSFKDRASSIGVMKTIEFGFDKIACAIAWSSGRRRQTNL